MVIRGARGTGAYCYGADCVAALANGTDHQLQYEMKMVVIMESSEPQ